MSEHRRHHHGHHQPAAQQLQSWRLICHGTQWIGDYGNCTRHPSVSGDDENDQQQQQQQPHVYSTQHVIQPDGNQPCSLAIICLKMSLHCRKISNSGIQPCDHQGLICASTVRYGILALILEYWQLVCCAAYEVDFGKMSKNYQTATHQMLFSSSKCTKTRFWLRLCPRPGWGANDAPQTSSWLGKRTPLPITP